MLSRWADVYPPRGAFGMKTPSVANFSRWILPAIELRSRGEMGMGIMDDLPDANILCISLASLGFLASMDLNKWIPSMSFLIDSRILPQNEYPLIVW